MAVGAPGVSVDIGATSVIVNSINFVNNDYLGKMTLTWYVKFKGRKS